jgi:hypothetical protein
MISAKPVSFSPATHERVELLSSIAATFSGGVYEPSVHGIDLKAHFEEKQFRLLETDYFSRDINAILSEVDAYPTEFFHESERRLGLWKPSGQAFVTRTEVGFSRTYCRII